MSPFSWQSKKSDAVLFGIHTKALVRRWLKLMKWVKSRRIQIAGRVAGLGEIVSSFGQGDIFEGSHWMTGMEIAMNINMYLMQVGFKNVGFLTVAEGRFK